jgi:hypothetical protein
VVGAFTIGYALFEIPGADLLVRWRGLTRHNVLAAVVFGYLVKVLAGNYSLSLLPLAAMTAVSAVVFTRIDPTVPLVEEPAPARTGS